MVQNSGIVKLNYIIGGIAGMAGVWRVQPLGRKAISYIKNNIFFFIFYLAK